MEKIAANHEVTPSEVVTHLTRGLAVGLGSPASPLNPVQVNHFTRGLHKRASENMGRREKLRSMVLETCAGGTN